MRGQKNIKLSDILSCFKLCSSKTKWPTNKDRKFLTNLRNTLRIS